MEVIDGIAWDYGPNDPIDYFDSEKSYYITKYRPINDTQGLDFDPDWFREDAKNKLRTGRYSGLIIGSKTHRDFWKERKRRCIEGYESNGYRLTGDNYFWLNFYRLKDSEEGAKASSGRNLAFPRFFVFQYEYFHYVEMCEILKKDVGLVKARSLGFSEMAASLCVRPFITTPNYRVLATAFSENHLNPLLTKIWSQLDWLNDETEGGFKRVRMVKNTDMHKRASKKDKEGKEFGHLAEIEGRVADNPQKVRGDRVERLFFEEIGSNKVFTKSYLQGEALVTVMGRKIGTRIAWGTGGDSGPSVEGIRELANKPDVFNILPHYHNYTPDGRYITSSMFIPAYRNAMFEDPGVEYVDKRGWCNLQRAKERFEKERLKKAGDPKALLIYKAEYCFTIEEALIQQGDNMFPREELAEQMARIEIYKDVPMPRRGHLTWKRDADDRPDGVKWRQDDESGKILILEHPLMSAEGTDYKNLYVGGIDSIDIGTADSTGTDKKPSQFCIVIKKRVFGTQDPTYVAMYKDRPRDPREAYEIAAKLLTYYGCQAVLESTRTAIITYFRDQKYSHLLMKRPRSTMSDVTKGNASMFGAPASLKVIEHYRELIYDYCLDYTYTMSYLEMVEQLLNYSDEKKKEFDIVAAMGMAELGDEELSFKKPEAREPKGKVFQDIGWWKDSKGYKHYGIIPKTNEEKDARTRISSSDSWLYKDLI